MWIVYVLVFILIAAGTILYLAGAAAAALSTAAVAIAVYGLGLPAAYLAALTKVLAQRPAGLAPPAGGPKPPEDADPAVLQYFYGPAMADTRHGMAVGYRNGQALWRWGADKVRSAMRDGEPLITVPPGIGGAAGMAVGAAAGTAITAGCALVCLVVVGLGTAGVRAIAAVLRLADSALLRIKNIRMVCPHCGERVPYPGYLCPGQDGSKKCQRRHRDVRPGRYGVVRRYCRCGTPMPTLLLLGSARMAAFCPYCGQSLEHRPGEVPEIVLGFFGATGAGKTRLVSAMVTQLTAWATEKELSADPGDQATAISLDQAEQLLRCDRATPPTLVQLPRSLVVRVTSGRVTRILHLFDAPGEGFEEAKRTDQLRYLREARTFILVIDPGAVAASWTRQLDGRPAERARQSPDHAYHQTCQQIEAMGVQLSEARLAVAFSHADVTQAPGGEVAEWARQELGLSNLIISARQHFKEARFFSTAAVATSSVAPACEERGPTIDRSIAVLLRWVLVGSRLTLPRRGR
jgi:hypothetical protein